jgi:hypothetical protein
MKPIIKIKDHSFKGRIGLNVKDKYMMTAYSQAREMERRKLQIERGQLKAENGLVA